METPLEVLDYVVQALESQGIPYVVGGSLASMAYGEPRLTRDIDLVVELRLTDIDRLVESFPWPGFYFDPITARAAVREGSQFNIIHPDSGVKIDLFIAANSFARGQLAGARRFRALVDREVAFSPPEDLILKKLEYYQMGESDKHLRDIAAMLQVSGGEIDREHVSREAARRGLGDIWQAVLRRVDAA